MNSTYIQEVLLKINGQDAEQTIKRLQQTIKNCAAEKEKLVKAKPDQKDWTEDEWKNWQKFTREMSTAERQLKKYGITSDYVKATLDNLGKKSLKELNASLKTMQNALDSGKIDRKTRAWSELNEAIKRTKIEIERVKNEQKNFAMEGGPFLQRLGEKWVGITTLIHTVAHAFSALMGKISGYVNQYAAMQEHVAGASKYTGMAAKDVELLNEEFKKIDTRTSRAALNDLAADAGRLGIAGKKDVLDFVQAADQINIALGEDLGEGAVKNIGKLANIFGDDKRMGLKQAMLSTASAINELAQNSSASEGNILDFTTRLSAMAKTAGLTQAQVMGLGAMFETQGLNAEVAATALSKVMQKMGSDTEKMAKMAGLNVQEFAALVKTDMNAALIEFAKGIGRLGGITEVSPALKELSLTGSGVSSVVNILAQNLDKVATQQDLATRAFNEGTSATNEAAKANSTAAANLELYY